MVANQTRKWRHAHVQQSLLPSVTRLAPLEVAGLILLKGQHICLP